MQRYFCSRCNIYALAINYGDELPICRCGNKLEELTEEE